MLDLSKRAKALFGLFHLSEPWAIGDLELVDKLLRDLADEHKVSGLANWAHQHPKETLLALGLIKCGPCMQIVDALDAAMPGLASELIQVSAENKDDLLVKQLVDRMESIERMELMSEILSGDRINRVRQAMDAARSGGLI